MKKNDNLNVAKKQKRDEFYTSFDDIQLEVNHYERHFENKTVLCNCDDPFESQFCFFFLLNFNYLKLKRLICTSYSSSPIISEQLLLFDEEEQPLKRGCGYVIDITEPIAMENGEGVSEQDVQRLLKSKKRGVKKLKGDGDFRSEECIEYLKQADIVVTNPPFSLFREYVAQLMEYKKKFLIIGNLNAITYKEVFPLIKDNEMWFGCGFTSGNAYFKMIKDDIREYSSSFYDKSTGLVKFGNVRWFTNLDHNKRHEKLELYMHYYGNEEHYPKYDNFDAINVNKVAEIPLDYFEINGNKALTKEEGEVQLFTEQNRTEQNRTEQNRTEQNRTEQNRTCSGLIGVPISFLDKYNPDQFIIAGLDRYIPGNPKYGRRFTINGRETYARIIIKRKV